MRKSIDWEQVTSNGCTGTVVTAMFVGVGLFLFSLFNPKSPSTPEQRADKKAVRLYADTWSGLTQKGTLRLSSDHKAKLTRGKAKSEGRWERAGTSVRIILSGPAGSMDTIMRAEEGGAAKVLSPADDRSIDHAWIAEPEQDEEPYDPRY